MRRLIGLEVHVQLGTKTKIFCGCPTSFGRSSEYQCVSRLSGPRGASGAESRKRWSWPSRLALAMHCEVNAFPRIRPEDYFYPELPEGYQISQYELPLAEHDGLRSTWMAPKADRVTRVHMEDDGARTFTTASRTATGTPT